jgi:hypothetical protein
LFIGEAGVCPPPWCQWHPYKWLALINNNGSPVSCSMTRNVGERLLGAMSVGESLWRRYRGPLTRPSDCFVPRSLAPHPGGCAEGPLSIFRGILHFLNQWAVTLHLSDRDLAQ